MSDKPQVQAEATSVPRISNKPAYADLVRQGSFLCNAPDLAGRFASGGEGSLVSQPPLIQAKLTVGRPNDLYEQEADRVADQVMRMPNPRLQCQVEPEEEKKKEKEPVQTEQIGGQTPQIGPSLAGQIRSLKRGGQPLPESERSFFEPRFGHDFSRVRVHIDARAAESARALSARAYTVGRHVIFATGQYSPETTRGKLLLAHELTHVVQQHNQALYLKPQSEEGPISAKRFPNLETLGKPWSEREILPKEYFQEENELFYNQLKVAHRGFGGSYAIKFGQNVPPEFKKDKATLTKILWQWHDNATSIVLSNHHDLTGAFIEAAATEIFQKAKAPGISIFWLNTLSAVEELAGILGLSPIGELTLDAAVNYISEALTLDDLGERVTRFISLVNESTEFQEQLSADLHNLTTLLLYHQIWLERCTKEELRSFKIPWTPKRQPRERVGPIIRSILQKGQLKVQEVP